MDFAQILDAWENQSTREKRKLRQGKSGNGLVEKASPPDWIRESEKYWDFYDKGEHTEGALTKNTRNQLREMRPDAEIDLHGMTTEEALRIMDRFIRDSHRQGLRKLMIIHGKGNHSKVAPVLKRAVTLYLERCPLTGETGTPPKKWGGSGATWVLLK